MSCWTLSCDCLKLTWRHYNCFDTGFSEWSNTIHHRNEEIHFFPQCAVLSVEFASVSFWPEIKYLLMSCWAQSCDCQKQYHLGHLLILLVNALWRDQWSECVFSVLLDIVLCVIVMTKCHQNAFSGMLERVLQSNLWIWSSNAVTYGSMNEEKVVWCFHIALWKILSALQIHSTCVWTHYCSSWEALNRFFCLLVFKNFF